MTAGVGALLGLIAAAGVLLLAAGVLAQRRPRLADRIGTRSAHIALAPRGPVASWLAVMRPWLESLSIFDRDEVAVRLCRAGLPADIERYRLEQLLWASSGAGVGLIAFIALLARRPGIPILAGALLAGLFASIGLLLRDRSLSGAIRARGRRMSAQLPTVADMLAFAVSAGESPLAAMDRVAALLAGDLPDEIGVLVAEVRGGAPLLGALRGLADRCPSPDVARFAEGISVAAERGTPMADVLRSQAADARAARRRSLLEMAGKREIAMLVPVVFLILPIVVVVALFPGIYGLSFTVP